MLMALVLLPLVAGIASFLVRSALLRRVLLLATAFTHASLTALAWIHPPGPAWGGTLQLDSLGLLFLTISSGLFLAASLYAAGYLQRETKGQRPDFVEGVLFSNAPEAVFTGCMLFFLAAMSLVTVTHDLGLLWVAIEATTLASAPLIYFHRHHRSLEATWKYLLVCSVGIALALLGNLFLAVAASGPGHPGTPLDLLRLCARASTLQIPWLKGAFIFLLVGYGTKTGLVPLHTWLPDAHSEAPSVVSALLSGALLNCGFLGILRAFQVCEAAGLGPYARELLVLFGLLSIGIAAAFLLAQTDYKRLLAYSSVEHMGMLALGIGVGGSATFGALLHAIHHSITKAMLFLLSGNILAAYRSKSAHDVRGVLKRLPVTGALWLAGLFAITGSPPFGTFTSELLILRGALDSGRLWIGALYLALLAVIFVGMATTMSRMAQGNPSIPSGPGLKETPLAILPPLALATVALILGIFLPTQLRAILEQAASALRGGGG